jgi:hypothetical protein
VSGKKTRDPSETVYRILLMDQEPAHIGDIEWARAAYGRYRDGVKLALDQSHSCESALTQDRTGQSNRLATAIKADDSALGADEVGQSG